MSKRGDGDKCDIHFWKGKSKWNEIRMKSRTQIIQNTQFCYVEHKKGEGFFFTDKIIVLRAQDSRSVFEKEHSGRSKGRRGRLGGERTAWPPTSWVLVHPPRQRATTTSAAIRWDTPAESGVHLLAMQSCLTGYLGQKWADPVVQVLLSSADTGNSLQSHGWSSVKQRPLQPTDPRIGSIWPIQQGSLQWLIFIPQGAAEDTRKSSSD